MINGVPLICNFNYKYSSMYLENLTDVDKADTVSKIEHMQTPNRIGPGVRRSKRSLPACLSRNKRTTETSNSVK